MTSSTIASQFETAQFNDLNGTFFILWPQQNRILTRPPLLTGDRVVSVHGCRSKLGLELCLSSEKHYDTSDGRGVQIRTE